MSELRTRGRWREGVRRCPRKELAPRLSEVNELCSAAIVEGLGLLSLHSDLRERGKRDNVFENCLSVRCPLVRFLQFEH